MNSKMGLFEIMGFSMKELSLKAVKAILDPSKLHQRLGVLSKTYSKNSLYKLKTLI